MKRANYLLLLLLVCASLIACKAPPQNGGAQVPTPTPTPAPTPQVVAVNPGDYFPSKPGSNWSYQGEGNEYASFTREVLFAAGDQSQFKEANGGTVSTSIYITSADSIKRVFFSGETYNPQNLLSPGFTSNDSSVILKNPLTTGASWTSGNDTKKIVDSQVEVKTPAGTFSNCIKLEIKSQGSSSTVYEYYGKGVGLVKREFIDGSATITSTLKAYKIAP